MKLVLLQSVNNLGGRGAIIEVAEGYARNFLLPKRLAARLEDSGALEFVREQALSVKAVRAKESAAEKIAAAVSGKSFVLRRTANEKGSLYSQVTGKDIAKLLLKRLGLHFDEKKFDCEIQLKRLGVFEIEYRDGRRRAAFNLVIKNDVHEEKK